MRSDRAPITNEAEALEYASRAERDLKKAAAFDRDHFVETMLAKIVGQDEIVHKVADILQSALSRRQRDPVNILLVGKAGLGKTTFCKAMAEAVFPGSKLLEFNLAQYKTVPQFQPAFFGSAGVWRESGKGVLSEPLISQPRRVIFFDELNQAHKDVYEMLLGPMEGSYTDEHLKKQIDLRQCVLVFAANWGHDVLEEVIAEEPDEGRRAGKIFEKLEGLSGAPWLLSRFKGGIYVMRSPDRSVLLTIAQRQLQDLAASYGLDLRYWAPQTAGDTVAEIWKRRDQGVRAVDTVINAEGYPHLFRQIQSEMEIDPDDPATHLAIRIDDDEDGFVIRAFEEPSADDSEADDSSSDEER